MVVLEENLNSSQLDQLKTALATPGTKVQLTSTGENVTLAARAILKLLKGVSSLKVTKKDGKAYIMGKNAKILFEAIDTGVVETVLETLLFKNRKV